MVEKQRSFAKLLQQGVSISEGGRCLEIDRNTGYWWKNGGVLVTKHGSRITEPVVGRYQGKDESGRYLSESDRVAIAESIRNGKSARAIANDLGRAVSIIARELNRNRASDGAYHRFTAQAMMRSRRPRPKRRRLVTDTALRMLLQHYEPPRFQLPKLA